VLPFPLHDLQTIAPYISGLPVTLKSAPGG
jgi:hypothetical protein